MSIENSIQPVLLLEGVNKSFANIQVLFDVALELKPGEVHALLGENGAGKSTLMKILGGIYRPDTGRLVFEGKEQHFSDYDDAVNAGIGIVFQEFSLVPYLNAVENVFLGREIKNRFGLMKRKEMRRRADEVFKRLGIDIPLNIRIDQLSVAEQQFIEIAKALILDARVLVLDEPTATLTPAEVEHLFVVMRQLKQQGVAMVFISHHLDEIFEICDRITVLRDGKFIATTKVSDTNVDLLVQMMVGRRIETAFPPKPTKNLNAPIVLEAEICFNRNKSPISFQLHEGEILGFAGLVGSGRTESVLGMIGEKKTLSCQVKMHGKPLVFRGAADALDHGIGLLPESRKTEGLILDFSIKENISINNYGKYRGAMGLLNLRKETIATLAAMQKISVKASGPTMRVGNLSGGNQQKVVIARWINHQTKILIFDEPTRGIDVGAKAEIYHLIRTLTEQGCSIIMISSELPEIIGMCDRVCVFQSGQIVKTLAGASITPQEVMKHATTGGSHVIH
ncbi:sugar ABC transporter ATP-binding protein [Bartonella sp. HY329]|uniref:sugar ABC transporter ATP-binding protein n=1 Tax=unclassified Bartonella TaxID=2645622 RepID=UPI0021C6A6B1|nr:MULTISPECIES: sugar ABC transporter ATP-binding protein [unclassified Bartonella]UXM94909.1 sugar ABC transporter ATP-binding protein [Bartonella sp. HY329]UXN09232.1 sugar ABC transporter ATP-binding protein [Bartonella sp. HY328]